MAETITYEEARNFLASLKAETRLLVAKDVLSAINDIQEDLLAPGLSGDETNKLVDEHKNLHVFLTHTEQVQEEWEQIMASKTTSK